MDTSKPFIGYRSVGRRPERQNDREGAKGAPLAAIRGWIAGTAGLPGDIEGLVRMLPGIERKEPVLPTSDFYKEWLPLRGESPVERAFTEAGSLFGGAGATDVARLARTGLSAGSRGALNAIEAAARNAQVPVRLNPQAGVIKMKGGDWLSGSVEEALRPLKRGPLDGGKVLIEKGLTTPELMAANPDVIMNNWIDKKLAKYIKNEMATPEDPVRALAERGVLHVDPANLYFNPEFHGKNLAEGQTALANSPHAKSWEGASDAELAKNLAGDYARNDLTYADVLKDDPWLAKVPAETDVYSPFDREGMSNSLGFNRLVDELRNATNPESGLPRELLLKYGALDKVTVPQAVERVAKINEWRAAQKAEADLMRANNAATVLHKEYPEGYRWVELKAAQDAEDSRKALQDALKYEGDTMGHCVGEYCDDVASGKSRIYSLRDKKGQPHTTIEITPGKPWNERSGVFYYNPELEPSWVEFHNALLDKGGALPNIKQFPDWLASNRPDVFSKYEGVFGPDPDRIVQIKGKQNRAPNPEYLPYVQDFVRSGKWSDVGDLQNTGLMKHPDTGEWVVKEQPGFSHGGAVNANNYDEARVNALAEQLGAEFAQ